MISTISTAGLREALSDILGRVRHKGERVVVTRSGKPVAVIIPIDELKALERLEDDHFASMADAAKEEGVFYDLEDVLGDTQIE